MISTGQEPWRERNNDTKIEEKKEEKKKRRKRKDMGRERVCACVCVVFVSEGVQTKKIKELHFTHCSRVTMPMPEHDACGFALCALEVQKIRPKDELLYHHHHSLNVVRLD